MLDKKFEMAIIGKNYLSIMYGLKKLKEEQKVLVINDKRAGLGDQLLKAHGSLEIRLLQQWGKIENISELQDSSMFSQHRISTYHLPTGRIRLGSERPSDNLREILRKLPFFFANKNQSFNSYVFDGVSSKRFDDQYFQYLDFLADFALNSRSGNDFERDFIINTLPPDMKELFLVFEDNYFKKDNLGSEWGEKEWSVKLLNFIAHCFLHFRFSINQEFYQVFHIFLYLIGPHYEVKDDLIEKNLLDLFLKKGGVLKNAELKEWIFYKGSPWSIELDSFEGVFHPKQLTYFGGFPKGLPLKIKTLNPILKQVTLKTTVDKTLFHRHDDVVEDFYYCNENMIGGEFALWKIGEKNLHVTASCPVVFYPGTKIEFFKERLLTTFNDELLKLFPNHQFGEWELSWDNDIYHQQLRENIKKPNLFRDKVYDYSTPSKLTEIKDFKNFGPMSELPLGFMSCLIKMRL